QGGVDVEPRGHQRARVADDGCAAALFGQPGLRPPPATAELVEARVRRYAVRPCAERGATVVARQPAHDRQQRLLRGVVRVAGVAGQPAAEPVDAVVVTAQEELERLAVTRLRGSNQGTVVT